MGTRVDEQISNQLSVRYCLHGGCAIDTGPIQLKMENDPGRHGPDSVSVLMCSELTREQAGKLRDHLDFALARWDGRDVRSDPR